MKIQLGGLGVALTQQDVNVREKNKESRLQMEHKETQPKFGASYILVVHDEEENHIQTLEERLSS